MGNSNLAVSGIAACLTTKRQPKKGLTVLSHAVKTKKKEKKIDLDQTLEKLAEDKVENARLQCAGALTVMF